MRTPIRLPHAYLHFDRMMHRVEARLKGRAISACGCSQSTVEARLAQRVVEYFLAPYMQLLVHCRQLGQESMPEDRHLLLAGAVLDQETGAISMSMAAMLAALRDFMGHWALALLAVMGLLRARPINEPATAVFGVGSEGIFHEGSDARFLAYCQSGPIKPLHGTGPLLIQSPQIFDGGTVHRARYHKYPLHLLTSAWRFGRLQRLQMVFQHLCMPFRYIRAILTMPLMALLSRDYAQAAMMAGLARAGAVQAVVYTNSNYTIQPLWSRIARPYQTHMIWYSQNTVPLVERANGLVSHVPSYRHIAVDQHWVWTGRYRDYLAEHAAQCVPIHVVGPIVWYLPEAEPAFQITQTLQILVFDVTPVQESVAASLGLLDNYYTSTAVSIFLTSIVRVTGELAKHFGIEVEVCVKHKREYLPMHDPGYISLVERLVAEGSISLIPADANIYSLLQTSLVSVVLPYSSPAYIADAMGKPAIYYDPTEMLQASCEPGKNVFFAGGEGALHARLREILAEVCTDAPRASDIGKGRSACEY